MNDRFDRSSRGTVSFQLRRCQAEHHGVTMIALAFSAPCASSSGNARPKTLRRAIQVTDRNAKVHVAVALSVGGPMMPHTHGDFRTPPLSSFRRCRFATHMIDFLF